MANQKVKYCPFCQSEKPVEEFSISRSTKDGLSNRCKPCWHSYNRDYKRRFPEKVRESTKKAVQKDRMKNPERYKTAASNYRARKMGATGTITKEISDRLYFDSEDRCGYCGIRLFGEYHIDHIDPLIRGGSNEEDNLCICCPSCNGSKAIKTVEEWQSVRGW